MQRSLSLFLWAVLGIILLSGCSWMYEIGKDQSVKSGSDLSEADMHMIPFEYTNQDGETVSNKDLEGQYWIADMVFTRCPTVCNLMTPNMLNLQGKVQEENLDVHFVSFTVDPDYDSPDQLKRYGDNYGADYSSWDFVTGYSQEDIQKLAKDSFKSIVEKDPENDDIIHATTFFLIDPDGQVIRSYDGLENDVDPIVQDLKQLTK